MTSLNSPEHCIREAKRLVESNKKSEIRLNANGGNSILLVCDPKAEKEYISKLYDLLPGENYQIIDLNKCLIDFVTDNKQVILESFTQLQSATHEIFKAPSGEESIDLFKEIIARIKSALNDHKIPVFINTGALYGTGIENIHLMENEIVMSAAMPIIILYPATKEGDTLMFLGKRPSSKYRCMIIQ